ncbi:MAG TPA: glycosyltransferase family 39 protein [Planctomycetota bacterium]|nr:glycosyltransferase family 39 protein [Planctomycetota bacterium]
MPTDVLPDRPVAPETAGPLSPLQPGRTRAWLWLAAALLIALVAQAVIVSQSQEVSPDGVAFIQIARALKTRPLDIMRNHAQHPGFPALILAAHVLASPVAGEADASSWLWSARVVSSLFGLGVIVLVWLLARRAFKSGTVAGVAVFGVAVIGLFRRSAADVLSDTPHLFFYLLAALCAVEGLKRPRWFWFVGVGLASGVAFWIRPEGLSVAMMTAAVLPVWAWRRRDFAMRAALTGAATTLLVAGAVMLPYVLITGKFSSKITYKERFIEQARTPVVSSAQLADAGGPAVADVLAIDEHEAAHERLGIRWFLRALREVWRKTAQGVRYVLMVPLFIGLFVPSRERSAVPSRVVAASLVGFHACLLLWLYYAGGYMSTRHVMPIVALMAPWVALGAILMARGAARMMGRGRASRQQRLEKVFIAILLITLAACVLPRTLKPIEGLRVDDAALEGAPAVGP